MIVSENKFFIGIVLIAITLLLVVSLVIAGTSYFNTKEIGALSSQCHENGGEETIEIYNNLTSEYSFECR